MNINYQQYSIMKSFIYPVRMASRLPIAAALIAMVLAAAAIPAAAQGRARDESETSAELWRAGISGGFGWLAYTADFIGLPGVPSCCPHYQDGSGNSIAAGVAGEMRLAPKVYGGVRLLFASYNGTLTSDEDELVTANGDTATAIFRHTIETTQPAIATEVMVGYRVLPELSVTAGMRGDLMLGGTYHQSEDIVSPATIRFENDQRQRLVFDGSIPEEKRLHLALIAGVRYDVPLNAGRTMLLSPEVQLWQGLGDLVDGITWKMRGIRAGLSLSYIGRDGTREPTPLAPGKVAEPEHPDTQPEPPKQDEPAKTDEPAKHTPNNGPSSNSDIPNSHP